MNKTQYCRRTAAARIAALMLLGTLLSGCSGRGPEVAPVSGRVTLDGAPLAGARIQFQPEASGGSPSYGAADQDGHYVLSYKRGQPGALIGWHTIRIESGAPEDSGSRSKPRVIPARYKTASELREEVKAGEDNLIHFELTTD